MGTLLRWPSDRHESIFRQSWLIHTDSPSASSLEFCVRDYHEHSSYTRSYAGDEQPTSTQGRDRETIEKRIPYANRAIYVWQDKSRANNRSQRNHKLAGQEKTIKHEGEKAKS